MTEDDCLLLGNKYYFLCKKRNNLTIYLKGRRGQRNVLSTYLKYTKRFTTRKDALEYKDANNITGFKIDWSL